MDKSLLSLTSFPSPSQQTKKKKKKKKSPNPFLKNPFFHLICIKELENSKLMPQKTTAKRHIQTQTKGQKWKQVKDTNAQ